MKTDADSFIDWIEQQKTLQGLDGKTYTKALWALSRLFVRTVQSKQSKQS